jgi:O-antigen biosynthesis protein
MPRVCIGIHVQSRPERLRSSIQSLQAHTSIPFDLVILPDDADQPLKTFIRRLDVQAVTKETAGAAASFNRLASINGPDVFVFLESGVRVSPRWLDHLLHAFDSDPRNGLAGPSTNNSWNQQCAFPRAGASEDQIIGTARAAEERFGSEVRALDTLHSLGDFCYAVRREVIESVGAADERYASGPCWEMDYNIRAARAGWRGVWACAAYVHRAPFTSRRRNDERRYFEASKRLYQDKFCGARLRGQKTDYRSHCRGDACANFAPGDLIEIKRQLETSDLSRISQSAKSVTNDERTATRVATSPPVSDPIRVTVADPLVTCIMPTHNRRRFVPQAIRCFLRQDYSNLELLVIDDGSDQISDCLPESDRIRYLHLDRKLTIGAKRNHACEQARGEFIVHWDDDDWYPADRVSRQIKPLREADCEVSGTSRILYLDLKDTRVWEYRYPSATSSWVGGNTLAYRKSFWARHRFPDIQVGEDSRFVWSAGGKYIHDLMDPTLCIATAHSENTSRKDINGAYWHPQSFDRVESLLGQDIYFYLTAGGERTWPLVSCIMPTFNRRAYVAQSLQSFQQQDYPERELIVVDDGSDPIEDLIPKGANISYLRLPRRTTIGAKRNLACQHARGDIIAHWDDDDWYAPDRLRYQAAPLLQGHADLTGLENAFVLQLPQGEFWGIDAHLHQRLFVGNVHGGTLVYRKELWTNGLRYPEVNLAEDASLIFRATRMGKRLMKLSNPGVFVYVRHGRNAWREFAPGTFIDPQGWRRISHPPNFPQSAIAQFQSAATAAG